MNGTPEQPLGLYVHLPWCARKCPYCDFNSHERQAIPEQEYVQALLQDLESDAAPLSNRTVASVFIGGGTPSLFSAGAIATLLDGIAARVALAGDVEITLEANPGSTEAARFADYSSAGVNRVSLGVQSFRDASLQALGRIHSAREAGQAFAALRAAGIDNINIDLMHGLPAQSVEDGLGDLEAAISLGPEHLSWYQLTIEPNTAFYRQPPQLPAEAVLGELERAGAERLADAGYVRYEVSAYARNGRDCRHNSNYWRFGDYLGIGAGAHGKLTRADGTVARSAKLRQPDSYMAAGNAERIASRRDLAAEELPGEFMLNALRLCAGVEAELFTATTGLDAEVLQPTLNRLREQGLMEVTPSRLCATALGQRYLDSVIGRFFPD